MSYIRDLRLLVKLPGVIYDAKNIRSGLSADDMLNSRIFPQAYLVLPLI